MDNRATNLRLDPDINSDNQWVPNFMNFWHNFKGVLKTKDIKAASYDQILPRSVVHNKTFCSNIPRKDLIILFDIYRQLSNQLIILTLFSMKSLY